MIIINYKDRRAIYEQIIDEFQKLILKGVLEPDFQLPSVRNLAMDLSINPNTIQRAYTELERQGFIYTVKGKGSFITANTILIEEKKEEILRTAARLAKEAREVGITQEQFIQKISEGFKEGKEND